MRMHYYVLLSDESLLTRVLKKTQLIVDTVF